MFVYIFIFSFLFLFVGCSNVASGIEKYLHGVKVRVLLKKASDKQCIVITSGAWELWAGEKRLQFVPTASQIRLFVHNRKVGIQNLAWDMVRLVPVQGSYFQIGECLYKGELIVRVVEQKLHVVNCLNIETYLEGVVPFEMPGSWPEAALAAQAVIARSYALFEMGKNSGKLYDVVDTVASQVYKGIPHTLSQNDYAKIQRVVQGTHGQVLLYNNALFKTFFHSTCGGHTANGAEVFGYDRISPLSGVCCSYCKDSKHFNWSFSLNVSQWQVFLLTLLKVFNASAPVQKMHCVSHPKNHRMLQLEFLLTDGKKIVIPASKFREILGTNVLKSTLFSMQFTSEGVLFQGKGYGHGVGLCQWGAKGLADKGHAYDDILNFYYPGACIYSLWK
jgi:stage II sporulation protein D